MTATSGLPSDWPEVVVSPGKLLAKCALAASSGEMTVHKAVACSEARSAGWPLVLASALIDDGAKLKLVVGLDPEAAADEEVGS